MKRTLLCTALAMSVQASALAQDEQLISVELNKGTMVKLDRPASSVVISDPGTADVQMVSPKLVFVRGKKIGETSLYATDSNDDEIMEAVIDVTHNISNLERAVKRIAPDADVSFKTIDGGLVMDGFASTVGESEQIRDVASSFLGANEKMVNMIKTNGSDQVMLKVKIVEMSRNDLKNLGVNLQNVTSNGNFGLQVLQGSQILFHPNNVDQTPDVFSQPTSVIDRGTNTNTALYLKYKGLSGVIDALETQGLASTLAEPNLTTTSGKSASFLAGGQFPIPVVQSSSGSAPTVTIQYQTFGVSLNFTPTVMSKNRMSINIATEDSTLDFSNPIQVSGITYPILDDRKASAVVELGSGDSFMLAGLIQNDRSNNISKYPGLGDLPVLGALFRSTSFQNNQSELVILVTPYIVHPVAEPKLQTPLDGYVPPSDFQLLMNGALYTQQPMNKEMDKQITAEPKLNGEGGFITE